MATLQQYKNMYYGTCLVCGTGDSVSEVTKEYQIQYPIIGVNAISQKGINPDYLVVIDRIDETLSRSKDILNTDCNVVFSKCLMPFKCTNQVNFKTIGLEVMPIEKIFKQDCLFSMTSATTVALSLAMYMGYTRIGIIGYDIKGHAIERHLDLINRYMQEVQYYANRKGIDIYNLSQESLLKPFRKIRIDEL